MEFPSHEIYPSLRNSMWELLLPLEFQSLNAPFPGNFKVNVPSPLEIPRLMYPSPGNLKLMHLSPGNSKVNAPSPLEIPRLMHPSPGNLKLMHLSPGNSKVNAPSPLEIPRLMHPLPWKFQGSSTGGVQIINGIAHFNGTTLITEPNYLLIGSQNLLLDIFV